MALLCVFMTSHVPTFCLAGSSGLHWQNVFSISETQGPGPVWEGRSKKTSRFSSHSLHLLLLQWSLKAIFFLWEAFSNLCTVSAHLTSSRGTQPWASTVEWPPLQPCHKQVSFPFLKKGTIHLKPLTNPPCREHQCIRAELNITTEEYFCTLIFRILSCLLYAVFWNVHMLPSVSAKSCISVTSSENSKPVSLHTVSLAGSLAQVQIRFQDVQDTLTPW